MAGLLHWESRQQVLILRGELDRETLLPLWQQRETLLAGKVCINVAQLMRVDSAGLALLVRLQHWRDNVLTLSGISRQLHALIVLYNLQHIIAAEAVT